MWIGYMALEDDEREIEIDPMESDEAMEEYIERCRYAFREEWFQYLDENQ